MNNTPCLHCLMLTILVMGFIIMMIGLSLIPDTPTKQTTGTTVDPPVDKTALVVGSYGFRLAMGGLTVDGIIILGYLYAIWKENRDVATVGPLESLVVPQAVVEVVPEVVPQVVPEVVPQPSFVKPPVSILKKGPVIEHIYMRSKTARFEGHEEPSRIAHSLAYLGDQTVSPV